jgi:hypothetical protein
MLVLVSEIVIIYVPVLIRTFSTFLSNPKPYYRPFPDLTMADFAGVLTPKKFFGAHFNWWQVKAKLWLQPMNVS